MRLTTFKMKHMTIGSVGRMVRFCFGLKGWFPHKLEVAGLARLCPATHRLGLKVTDQFLARFVQQLEMTQSSDSRFSRSAKF